MIENFLKWNRRRRFVLAYKILRNEANRHKAAGHRMHFHAVNESTISMVCVDCPNLQPTRRRL